MERITKRFKTGEAYFDGKNGKSTSDNQGRIFGEAAERLAWIEDMIEAGRINEVLSKYGSVAQPLSLCESVQLSTHQTIYSVKTAINTFVDVLHSTEDNELIRILSFSDNLKAYDANGNHLDVDIDEEAIIAFVHDIIKNANAK